METFKDLLNHVTDLIDETRENGYFKDFDIWEIREMAQNIDMSDEEYDMIDEKLEELFLLYMSNWENGRKIVEP